MSALLMCRCQNYSACGSSLINVSFSIAVVHVSNGNNLLSTFFFLHFPAGWDGSDEWIRAQFKLYLLSLLSTIQHTGL